LCEREVWVGLGGKGKRVKQNQTDMMQLRRGCLQSVKISRRGGYLTVDLCSLEVKSFFIVPPLSLRVPHLQ